MGWKYRIDANENSCEKCDKMDGKVIPARSQLSYFTHPNCQCSTSRVSESLDYPKASMTKKARSAFNKENKTVKAKTKKKVAKNSMDNEFTDENIFTHFLHSSLDPLNEFTNDDELLIEFPPDSITHNVMVSPFGEFRGYDVKSDKAIKQILNSDTLKKLVASINEEILVDVDHASVKEPMERDTGAVGWASNFKVINKGSNNINGLYCDIKWTPLGKKMIDESVYRYLSPTWLLNENYEPIKMLSIALTNKPALPLAPIMLNTAANDFYKLVYKDTEMKILNEICEKLCLNTIADGEEITDEKVKEITDKVEEVKEKSDNYDKIKEDEAKADEAKKAEEAEKALVDEFNKITEGMNISDDVKEKIFDLFKFDRNTFDTVIGLAQSMNTKPEVSDSNEVAEETEEVKEEVKDEEVAKEEVATNSEVVKEEIDDKDIATYEEVKSGEANPIKKKKEVIDLEVLNSTPDVNTANSSISNLKEKLKSLKGKEYTDFIRQHKAELLAEFDGE